MVGNPEDRFSHNEAHISAELSTCFRVTVRWYIDYNSFSSLQDFRQRVFAVRFGANNQNNYMEGQGMPQ